MYRNLNNLKEKLKSDKGAMGSVETLLLVAAAIIVIFAVTKYIMEPIQSSSTEQSKSIEKMNPE